MGTLFYRLGQLLGAKARQANWLVQSLTGDKAAALRAEYAVGRDLARALLTQSEADPDPALQHLVAELGSRLAACLREPRPFHFVAIRAPEVNAYALPGGFVFVTRPLCELCQGSPDEIAFLLGHEMGHVVHGHAIERILTNSAIQTALSRWNPAGGLLRTSITGLAASLLQQGYSREQEFAADQAGLELATSAGFDPTGALRLFDRLQELSPGPPVLGGYFASHPPAEVRRLTLQRSLLQ